MSTKNEYRAKVSIHLLWVGSLFLLIGFFAREGVGFWLFVIGGAFFSIGLLMATAITIIHGSTGLINIISQQTEPVWKGSIIYSDGGIHKIRYVFDKKGRPLFVAKDILNATNSKKFNENIPLLSIDKKQFISETNTLSYLTAISINNHEAHRLILNIRNNVLRIIDKPQQEYTQSI